jgi:hypothetical protein
MNMIGHHHESVQYIVFQRGGIVMDGLHNHLRNGGLA